MKILLILISAVFGILMLGWFGLQIPPNAFPAFPQRTPALTTIPLPAGLPAPVERFYRQMYGEQVPLIESAVITGRVSMRLMGLPMHGRFRFIHEAGKSYRHYIEVTWFGLPILKVNEQFIDGKNFFEMPVGVIDNDPNTNQGANLLARRPNGLSCALIRPPGCWR